MAEDPWRQHKPNLSKIPAHLRQNRSKPIPFRPFEVHSRILIASAKPGLNYPNGRLMARAHKQAVSEGARYPDAAVLELADFTARTPLVSVFVAPPDVLKLVKSLARAYTDLGGDLQEVIDVLSDTGLPPKLANPLYPKET